MFAKSKILIRSTKEIVRHLMHRMKLKRQHPHLEAKSRGERFSKIYEIGFWQQYDANAPGSGSGSSVTATSSIRNSLPVVLSQLKATQLLDVGCGDFTWMKDVELPCPYVGIDIVPAVIENNQKLYGSPQRTFILRDAVEEALPECDIVLCREVLFHLSLEDAISVLKRIFNANPRFLILTTDRDTLFNANIETGDFRLLNLEKTPFKFPVPFSEIRDAAVLSGRALGIWKMEDIKNALK